jgi:hypothetical protein
MIKGQIYPIVTIIKKWKWNNDIFNLEKVSVFVGKVSSSIQKELTDFSKNYKSSYKNTKLDNYFGKNFVKTLTDLLNIKGGDEINFDDIFESSIDTISLIPTIETKPTIETIPISEKKYDKVQLEFINQSIWSVETPMDLKEKLWTYLNIPMFCQNLSIINKSGETIPLYYNIYNNNKLVRHNLIDTILIKEKYNNIPLMDHYYAFRDFFYIETLDNFELLESFITHSSSLIIDLYDAQDFLNNLNLSELEKDKNLQQLLYYGFFILFWPMLTEDVFNEYINNNGNINQLTKIFPELLPKVSEHKSANEKENELFNLFYTLTETGTSYDVKILKELEKNLYIRIIKNTINNYAYGDNKQIILSLRNLFDEIELTDQIIAIKYSTLYSDQRIEMHKTFKTTKEITQSIPLNSLLIRCMVVEKQNHKSNNKEIKHKSYNKFDIHFYENGNYLIKCLWGENSEYTFDEAIKIVSNFVNNNIIKVINNMKGNVIHPIYSLLEISPLIVGYSDINAEIYYRKNLTSKELHLFKYILQDLCKGKLLIHDILEDEDETISTLKYYLWKGNYQQDRELLQKKYLNISNTYEYLTKASINNKWNQIYVKNKSINISLRETDIKFNLNGMWDKEFNIIYSYILLSLYLLQSNLKHIYEKLISKEKIPKLKLSEYNVKSLKQIDPVLYDFKRYNSNLVYSKICQRPNQPKIITIDEYKSLSEKEKEKVIKYWNYTTKTDAYYYAPNPKYPYINFIVGKHPLNYCIPCAKKTSYIKKSNIKHLIYEGCLKEHSYEKGYKNIIVETRYIMNYGKQIEAGRLCKLPENTLEPLFYESFYENAGFDEECYQCDKYFIVGVSQQLESLQNMGMINTIILTLETTLIDFINNIKKKILNNPNLFNILLNGQILNIFYNYKEFNDIISKIFITHTLVETDFLEINWTLIFIDILFYYFNIIVVEFRDKHKIDDAHKEETIPGDFIELQINQKLDIITSLEINNLESYQLLLILTKENSVNPIYMVNPIVYFKSKIISQKLFNSNNNIVNILNKLLLYTKQFHTSNLSTSINYYTTINALNEFIKQSKNYEIITYYINKYNQCYYIEIKQKQGNNIYLPVALTNWSPSKNININHKPYIYKNKMDLKTLNVFLNIYNKWILSINPASIEGIKIDKWISSSNGHIFGFMFGSINYYFNDISTKVALAIKSVPIWKMPYNIIEINKQIAEQEPIHTDPLVKNISESFYENHLYQLLLLEFTTLFLYEKNNKLRIELKKIISNINKNNLNEDFNKILKLLDNYYLKIQNVQNELKLQDYNRIIEYINKSITKFIDKNKILEYIDENIYNFDKLTINKFKTMNKEQIKKELKELSKKITQFGNIPKISEIPNILISCSSNNAFYCKNSKLIISEKKLDKLIDILAMDIQNPMKEKWIFTPIFTDYIINFLKFKQRPLETITIQLT